MEEVLKIALTKEIPDKGKKALPEDSEAPDDGEEHEETQEPPIAH